MKENNSFLKGLNDGSPICFGYLSVAFAFGIIATESGLSVWQAVLISMLNVTSAGQLAAVPIMTLSGGLFELALTQLVINLRYALMSVSLSQRLGKSIKMRNRFLISFMNTDEVFAVAIGQKQDVGKKYMYGLILTPYLGWSVGTLIGAMAGNILPEVITASLGLALYAMFIAIVIPPAKKDKPTALCLALAIALSCAFYYIPMLSFVPNGFVIIICAALASAIFAVFAPIKTQTEDETNG